MNPVDRINGTSGPFIAQEIGRSAVEAIERLQADLAACRADAERYRWLRSQTVGVFDHQGTCFMAVGGGLDVLVDSGIRENKGGPARPETQEK